MKRLLLLLLLAACSSAPPVEPRVNPPEVQRSLASEVARLSTGSCGSCHTKSSPKADPHALAIFDYERVDWPAMLSEARLRSYRKRLWSSLDDEGKRTVDLFVQGELALRMGPGSPSASDR